MSRAEHLAWCKARALQYVDEGDVSSAFASLISDLGKHPETQGHAAGEIGMIELMTGHLQSPEQMRDFIEGVA